MTKEEMEIESENGVKKDKKKKKGIIYLSTLPPYMNVLTTREYFSEFGEVGRIFLQPSDKDISKDGKPKKKRNKYSKHFSEGWVEFEKKSIAKKVALLLNNKQVSTKKKSKQYDYIWSMKYLRGFKWTHLNERLAYEKAVRRQKLRTEISQAKKQASFFNINLERSLKSKKTDKQNTIVIKQPEVTNVEEKTEDREEFLKNLFN